MARGSTEERRDLLLLFDWIISFSIISFAQLDEKGDEEEEEREEEEDSLGNWIENKLFTFLEATGKGVERKRGLLIELSI